MPNTTCIKNGFCFRFLIGVYYMQGRHFVIFGREVQIFLSRQPKNKLT